MRDPHSGENPSGGEHVGLISVYCESDATETGRAGANTLQRNPTSGNGTAKQSVGQWSICTSAEQLEEAELAVHATRGDPAHL